MSRPWMLVALCGGLLLVACDKKEAATSAAPTAASAAAPAAAAPTPVPAAPEVDVSQLPVEEQYEEEAEKEITPDNLSAQLDALEKEIAAP